MASVVEQYESLYQGIVAEQHPREYAQKKVTGSGPRDLSQFEEIGTPLREIGRAASSHNAG
jgi:hypothetical protein